jgi:non-specific serine/threonine protein kinase/serine/threonine-protein kinase
LSEARLTSGALDQAARLSEQGLADVRAELGAGHPASAVVAISLGRVRAAQGRGIEAAALLDEAEKILAALGPAGASQIKAINQIRTRYGLR